MGVPLFRVSDLSAFLVADFRHPLRRKRFKTDTLP